MATEREYLVSLGLAKPGRGRFSRDAVAALDKAKSEGVTFDSPAPAPKSETPAAPKPPKAPKPVVVKVEAPAVDAKAARSWARQVGMKVGDRGRLHPDVIAAYLAANPDAKPVEGKRPTPLAMPKQRPVVRATDIFYGTTSIGVGQGKRDVRVGFDRCVRTGCGESVTRCTCSDGPKPPIPLDNVVPGASKATVLP